MYTLARIREPDLWYEQSKEPHGTCGQTRSLVPCHSGRVPPMAVTIPEETLSDDAPVLGRGPVNAWLIFIGSSENDFSEAGKIWSLDGLSKVRFGRVSGAELRDEREDDELAIKIPLGWVSGRHSELRIVKSGVGLEFDLCDLDSRNGTHIERQAIPGMARLAPTQVFEVGRSFWMIREVTSQELPPE